MTQTLSIINNVLGVIIFIFFALYLGKTEIILRPFKFRLERPLYSLGYIVLVIAFAMSLKDVSIIPVRYNGEKAMLCMAAYSLFFAWLVYSIKNKKTKKS